MKGLARTGSGRFLNDTAQQQRASKQYLEFILSNKEALLKNRNGQKLLDAAENMDSQPKETLTPKRMSYIDDIYEATMKGMGLPSYKGQKTKYGVNFKA